MASDTLGNNLEAKDRQLKAGEWLGEYRIGKLLATGGMAEVYAARPNRGPVAGRAVVVKRLLPHLVNDEAHVNMFFDEAQISSQLHHPNIAAFFEMSQYKGSLFQVLEYVDGCTLSQLLKRMYRRRRHMRVPEIALIGAAIGSALAHAHCRTSPDGRQLGIIHRDISLGNILVSNRGIPKLIDFGIAKARERNVQTQAGICKGKFAYMAPEQILSRDIDGRADLFSLGVVLYELATTRRLFAANEQAESARLVLSMPIPDPRTIRPGLPEWLSRAIMKCLEREPRRRFSTGRELEETLLLGLDQRATQSAAQRALKGVVKEISGRMATGTDSRIAFDEDNTTKVAFQRIPTPTRPVKLPSPGLLEKARRSRPNLTKAARATSVDDWTPNTNELDFFVDGAFESQTD